MTSNNNYYPHEKGAPPPEYPAQPAATNTTGQYTDAIQPSAPQTSYQDQGLAPAAGPQEKQQQQFPPQQGQPFPPQQIQQGHQKYQNVTPLHALAEGPAVVDCPACGAREVTRTEYQSGTMTHIAALLCCCVTLLGCIPYMMKGFKDVEHKCGNCGVLLASWKRSGGTVVHQHS